MSAPNPSTTDALDMLEEVSARARAMKISLVAYPVEDVEAVCAALRAVRAPRALDGHTQDGSVLQSIQPEGEGT